VPLETGERRLPRRPWDPLERLATSLRRRADEDEGGEMAHRILTSHAGSLPRPERLIELDARVAGGEQIDDTHHQEELRQAVIEVVARQREAGIDVVNDGEFGHTITTSTTTAQGAASPASWTGSRSTSSAAPSGAAKTAWSGACSLPRRPGAGTVAQRPRPAERS